MISAEEFRTAAVAEGRLFLRRALLLIAAMLLGMAVVFSLVVAYRDRLRELWAAHPDDRLLHALPHLILFAVITPPLAASWWLLTRRPTRDRRLRCPHCGRGLAGVSGLVLTDGNCAFC